MYYELTDHFIVAADAQQAWDFFSNAENLPKITPPWLKFTNRMASPIKIDLDTNLDYTISWLGVPVKWRTKIIDWQPPRTFVDLQTRGPYTLWHHQHTFTPTEEGMRCFDRVIYKLPFGLVGRISHAMIVRNQLIEIFRYRRKVIGENLGWVRAILEDVKISKIEW